MANNNNNAAFGLAIVGIVGFIIVFHNLQQRGGTMTDVITLEILGWMLVGIALSLGIMYAIAPIPVKLNHEPIWDPGNLHWGDSDNRGASIGCRGGDEHAAIEGGFNVLDNVVLTD